MPATAPGSRRGPPTDTNCRIGPRERPCSSKSDPEKPRTTKWTILISICASSRGAVGFHTRTASRTPSADVAWRSRRTANIDCRRLLSVREHDTGNYTQSVRTDDLGADRLRISDPLCFCGLPGGDEIAQSDSPSRQCAQREWSNGRGSVGCTFRQRYRSEDTAGQAKLRI